MERNFQVPSNGHSFLISEVQLEFVKTSSLIIGRQIFVILNLMQDIEDTLGCKGDPNTGCWKMTATFKDPFALENNFYSFKMGSIDNN